MAGHSTVGQGRGRAGAGQGQGRAGRGGEGRVGIRYNAALQQYMLYLVHWHCLLSFVSRRGSCFC